MLCTCLCAVSDDIIIALGFVSCNPKILLDDFCFVMPAQCLIAISCSMIRMGGWLHGCACVGVGVSLIKQRCAPMVDK